MGGGRPDPPTLGQRRRDRRTSRASARPEITVQTAVGLLPRCRRWPKRCPSSPSPAEGDTSGSITSGEDRKPVFFEGRKWCYGFPGRTLYRSSLVVLQIPPLNEQPPPHKNCEQAHGSNYRKPGLPQHALLFIFSTPHVIDTKIMCHRHKNCGKIPLGKPKCV